MIKTLQKKICTLLILLLTIIWLGILLIFVHISYQNNRIDLKRDVLTSINNSSWKNFIKTNGNSVNLDGIPYCLFSLDNNNEPHVMFHTFPNRSEKFLLEQGRKETSANKQYSLLKKNIVIYPFRHRTGVHYILLVSAAPALKATLPVIILCLILAVLGITVFTVSSRLIFRWMIRPVENMIDSEKKFISNASHELKTPLAVISANAELLAPEVEPDNRHLQYIRQETERMISLVNKMLTLVRLDAPQWQNTHSVFCVDEALLDIIYPMESVAYEKQLSLHLDIQENMEMDGNREQLQNLISILLNNAISYTPQNGEIEITCSLHNRKMYLSVANSGAPIPEEQRVHLFDRFFRADEARETNEHFGLGLSIAKSIVVNLSGKISVQSQNGKNIFSVVLPALHHYN